MKVLISCKEATNYISQQEEKKLSSARRLQLWLHLAVCTFCKLFYVQNQLITRNAQRLREQNEASLSASEKEFIILALEREE